MYTALIIDDEKPVRIAITALGNWSSHSIEIPKYAFNGSEGIIAMRELHPNIVFVDMQMPVMNGIQFLQLASKEFPDVKYIVVSGYDAFEYAQAALKNGAIDYLLKPVVAEELESALVKAVTQLNIDRNIKTTPPLTQIEISADEAVYTIKTYVDNHYCEELNISMFSDKYYFSKEYLSKLFKKKYDYGIYEYALNLRMQRSKELLLNYDLPIKDISDRLGYNNNNYFSKAFKNYYNMSPSEFRDRNR